jgi:hypothetical protein
MHLIASRCVRGGNSWWQFVVASLFAISLQATAVSVVL